MRAMRAQLGSGEFAEVREGPLWLLARRDKSFPGGAYEGFIPESEIAGPAAVEDWRQAPEGHYVLACARPGRLSLLRALSGGERLFHTRVDGTVLFSSSLRPLLAHPRIARRLDSTKLREALLTGLTLSGEETLIDGIAKSRRGTSCTLPMTRASIAGTMKGCCSRRRVRCSSSRHAIVRRLRAPSSRRPAPRARSHSRSRAASTRRRSSRSRPKPLARAR